MLIHFEQMMNRLIDFALLTDQEEAETKLFLLWVEENNKRPSEYIKFIEEFNRITGKKYKPQILSREAYYKDSAIYSFSDRISAVKNALTDPYLKSHSQILNPTWILKTENTAKYINYTFIEPKNDNNANKSEAANYNAI